MRTVDKSLGNRIIGAVAVCVLVMWSVAYAGTTITSFPSPLAANIGGTGQTSYTQGDLLFASSTTTIGKLSDVATGQVLASGGTSTAPAYTADPTVTSIHAATVATTTSAGVMTFGRVNNAANSVNGAINLANVGDSLQVSINGASYTTLGGVTSVTGTSNQVTVSPTTGSPVVSLPSAITLPGTLTAGGTVTMGAHTLDMASATFSGQPTFSSSQTIPGVDATGGTLTFKRFVVAKTADYSVVTADSGKVFTTVGAGGAVNFTLPTAASGLEYWFEVGATQTLTITAGSSTTIQVGDDVSSSAGTVHANVIGYVIHIVGTSTTTWITLGGMGTWTTS